jgi:hypothetical protein
MNPTSLAPFASRTVKALNDAAMVTRMSHWNVRGPEFYECHLMFGRIYDSLSGLMDGFVETLRVFGFSPDFEMFSGPGISLESYNCQALARLSLEYVISLVAYVTLFLDKIKELDKDPRFPALENHLQNIADQALTNQYLLQAYMGM